MNHIQKSLRLQDTAASSPLDFAAPGVGHYNCIDSVVADSDAAALVTVESPAGTVLWQSKIAANTRLDKSWPAGEFIRGAENAVVRVKVSTGTVNIAASGFVTP